MIQFIIQIIALVLIVLCVIGLLWNYHKINDYLLKVLHGARLNRQQRNLPKILSQIQYMDLDARLLIIQQIIGDYNVRLEVEGNVVSILAVARSGNEPPPVKERDHLAH